MKLMKTSRMMDWGIRIFLLLLLLFGTLLAHKSPFLEGTSESRQLALHFQEVALDSMKDSTSDRARAIELYWQAHRMGSRDVALDQMQRLLTKLYSQLPGSRIARVTLSRYGWQTQGPAEPVILTQGKLSHHLLLVLANQTREPYRFSVSGADAAVDVLGESRSLVAGGSTDLFVRLASQRLGRFRSSLRLESAGQTVAVPIHYEVRRSGRLVARLWDAEGRPTAARLFLRADGGFTHIPEGSIDRVMWISGEHFFYADAVVQADLPQGKASLEVVKGFDYLPVTIEVNIKAQETTWVDVRLKRLEGMNAQGWYSGDVHIHGNYRGDQFITPEDNFLMVRAEDLNVGNMMVANSDGAQIHDEQHFAGKLHALSSPEHLMYWNEEMRNRSMYGHLILLNLKELVRPIYTGFPGTPNWEDYPANYYHARKTQEQGGYVAYAHPALVFDEIPTAYRVQEAVVDVPLGLVDAFEVFNSRDEPSMALWYKFLNAGFKLGIAGGSDAMINHKYIFVAGGVRSYVYTGPEFIYEKWVDGLSRGRAFATVGPLLSFEIEGHLPGQEFRVPQGPVQLTANARAVSWIPMTKLEIVSNGKVIDAVSSDVPAKRLEWTGVISVERSSWVAARVWGPEHRRIANSPFVFAERRSPLLLLANTGASYVHIGDSPIFSSKDHAFLLRWIDSLIEQVKTRGQFATEDRRQEVIKTFLRARRIYEVMRE